MDARKWQRKTWWLARYFELVTPMTFTFYLGINITLIGRRKMPLWVVVAFVGLIYLTMLREVIEATWERQACDWLASIKHRLTPEEAIRLEARATEAKLKLCRVWVFLVAAVVTIVAFGRWSIWTVLARIVMGVMLGALALTHVLMARIWMREEAELWSE